MLESPIKRKLTHYPRDFAPARVNKTPQPLRYTHNARHQTQISQQHRLTQVEQIKNDPVQLHKDSLPQINPQKMVIDSKEPQQDDPLIQHEGLKWHNLDAQLLKRPRFSLKQGEEIPQEQHQTIHSPNNSGLIRHQYDTRQAPLPQEDTCRIEHFPKTKPSPVPDSVILFKSSSHIDGRRWISSQKEVIQSFKQSRMKRSSVHQLPVVSKTRIQDPDGHLHAHQLFNSFRMRQKKKDNLNIGQVNNLLLSLKQHRQQSVSNALPRFKPSSTVQRLRDEVNFIARQNKKHVEKHNDQYSEQQGGKNDIKNKEYAGHVIKSRQPKKQKGPEFIVSYRTSLAYLKDIHSRIKHIQEYQITVKVPKLFTESLLTREQDKSQLYQTAQSIFSELHLPHDNIVVKRYTNCVTATCRNIGLIWSFEGRRYLGGWQSEYLDEGFKHGVGLEWQPREYVYYGEFVRNKREGLGVLKDSSEQVVVGYWRKGQLVEVESESEKNSGSDNDSELIYQ